MSSALFGFEKPEFGLILGGLRNQCADCHADGAQEGGFSLESLVLYVPSSDSTFENTGSSLGDVSAIQKNTPDHSSDGSAHTRHSLTEQDELTLGRWERVRSRLADGSMPPADYSEWEPEEREATVRQIDEASLEFLRPFGPYVGPPQLRRLTNHEYANTIRDLLGVHFNAAAGLPQDFAGGEGFTNATETLGISPVHAEKYFEAAATALEYALANEASRKRLTKSVDATLPFESYVAGVLTDFLPRAFRRSVPEDLHERYLNIAIESFHATQDRDRAMFDALHAALVSPEFLFVIESSEPTPPDDLSDPSRQKQSRNSQSKDTAVWLSAHELATRLSYFLWTTQPDRQLRNAADDNSLLEEEVLIAQTKRMLEAKGTNLRDSLEQFIGQWLGTADLGVARQFDTESYPIMKEPVVAGLRNQPVYFFEELIQTNESLEQLIDSDWTFLNDELTWLYQIPKKDLERQFVQNLVRVQLPEAYRNRGGLLGMGGIHALSSYPNRTSPVLRGVWVQEHLFGVELPPPPPDVPALAIADSGEREQLTVSIREQLIRHREDAQCASCHNRIDPLGFALDEFDEIGRIRPLPPSEESEAQSASKFAAMHQIENVAQLKEYVRQRKRDVMVHLTRKLLGYALCRSLTLRDLLTIHSIVDELEQNEYQAQNLILSIVKSRAFRMKAVSLNET